MTSTFVAIGIIAAVGVTFTARADASGQSRERSARLNPALSTGRLRIAPAPIGPAPDRHFVVVPHSGEGLAIYPEPGAPTPSQTLPAVDELGSPLVLLGVGSQMGWLHVLLPTRPNGATGWVRAGAVTSSVPAARVEISLAAHSLRLVRISDGAVLLTSVVGIGRPSTPTPTGEFFVRDLFPTGTMNHPYGPFAFGLSGHSDVFQHFGTGDGRIAIHGTNDPASIGADASNGCVHVPNDVDLTLIDQLTLGTPVIIS